MKKGLPKGFTLIELLVVISIIAVLMSVMMPALGKAREMAKKLVCSSNLRSAGQLLNTYAVSYNGKYPYAFKGWKTSEEDGGTAETSKPLNWIEILMDSGAYLNSDKYGSETGFWSCPSCQQKRENPNSTAPKSFSGVAIGMNDGWTNLDKPNLPPTITPRDTSGDSDWFNNPISSAKIKKPANTVLVADVRAAWAVYTWRWYDNSAQNGSFIDRHSGGCNFLLVDGHVEYEKPESDQVDYNICRPLRFKYGYDNLNY